MDVDSFAWLVPLALASFSGAFLVLRLNGIGSFWWATAFLSAAVAFAISLLPRDQDAVLKPVIEDSFFLFAFAAYAMGTAHRFATRPRFAFIALSLVIGIGGAALALYLYASVRMELLAVYTGCLLLLLEAARIMHRRERHLPDRILFALSLGFAANLLLQSLAMMAVTDPTLNVATWGNSFWAYFLQASGATIGILFALVILIAIGRDLIEAMRRMSELDPLTGVLNRRGFERRSTAMISEARRRGRSGGCLILVDIDHFKRVNDSHGHWAGDAVISAMGSLLDTLTGEDGCVARLGGEEFAVFLASSDLASSRLKAEAMHRAFSDTQWPAPMSGTRLTASFGLTDLAADETVATATPRADRMLYFAKRNGRNQVCWCSSASRIVLPDENGIGHPGGRFRPAPVSAVA